MLDDEVIKRLLAKEPEFGEEQARSAGGLSEAVVIRLKTPHREQILKVQPGTQENDFFTRVAPRYFPKVSWLPIIYGSGIHEGFSWLLMEFIPNLWPRERYNFDPDALAVLAQLHQIEAVQSSPVWEDHTWSEAQIIAAEKYLPTDTLGQVTKIREAYLSRRERNSVLCSGDPNAPNWLIRDNGEIVLIDWQMVSIDNRALDIAGWMAYSLDYEEIEKLAEIYEERTEKAGSQGKGELALDVFIFYCRRCTTNFWRAEISTKPELWAAGIKYMKETMPGWLKTNGKVSGLI